MEYFIVWILFACAAYSVAKSKGKNKFFWFFIGLLIGPIAALILALLPAGSGAEKGYK